jgi:hypothetical protein
MNRILALIAALWSSTCFGLDCAPKEYAEYKDQALTALGRHGMAFDYCRAEGRITNATKQADLAIQYKQSRDAKTAIAGAETCMAEKSKIENALTAAKATKTLTFMHNGCVGSYKIGDK